MDIKCPHCGIEYEVDESVRGRKVECATCGTVWIVGETHTSRQLNDLWRCLCELCQALCASLHKLYVRWQEAVQKDVELERERRFREWQRRKEKERNNCMTSEDGSDNSRPEKEDAYCEARNCVESPLGSQQPNDEKEPNAGSSQAAATANGGDYSDFTCPHCGKIISIEKSNKNAKIECPYCGKKVDLSQLKECATEQSQENQTSGWFEGWFTIEGRATRQEYWWTVLTITVILVLIWIIVGPLVVHSSNTNYDLPWGLIILASIASFACFIFAIPVSVRRLHDRNMSGWFLLAFWVGGLIPFVWWFAWIAQFVIAGCLDGTRGQNDFGPDPKGRQPIQPQATSSSAIYAGQEAPEDRLMKLRKLKEAGIISEEEYEEKRRKILAQI